MARKIRMLVCMLVTAAVSAGSWAAQRVAVDPFADPPAVDAKAAPRDKAGKRARRSALAGAKAAAFWGKYCTARGERAAERAAQAAALRRLAARVPDVAIDHQRTIGDVRRIAAYVTLALPWTVGWPIYRYHDDAPIVEVELRLSLRRGRAALKAWAEANCKDDRDVLSAVGALGDRLKERDEIVTEIGLGVPPQRDIRGDPGAPARRATAWAVGAPAWLGRTLVAEGRAMADRKIAHHAEAMQKAQFAAFGQATDTLFKQLWDLKIAPKMSVRDFAAGREKIRRTVLALEDHLELIEDVDLPGGGVQVAVAIRLKLLWNAILHFRKHPPAKPKPAAPEVRLPLPKQPPKWVGRTLRAVGRGKIDPKRANKSQANLLAFRAAELDARRTLAREIHRLMILPDVSVENLQARSGTFREVLLAFQQGVRVVESSRKELPGGWVEVAVEADMGPLWKAIRRFGRGKGR